MKKAKIFLIACVSIGILYNVVWFIIVFFAKNHTKDLYKIAQKNGKIYVYESYSKALNNVLYIDDLKDSNSLIYFYDYRSRGIDTTIDIEIKTMPLTLKEPIYILSDVGPASKMIEVIDFDTACWGYIKGYVYKNTTHLCPPDDSLVKKEEEYNARQNSHKSVIHVQNPYGFYCNECTGLE